MAEVRVPARAALAGNPSDGYGGAVLAVTVPELAAAVSVAPARRTSVEPPSPLLAAALRRFAREHGGGAMAVHWQTTIPREVGLAGSSALVIAALRALARERGIEIAPADLAADALSIEEELGIAAGLQDRVTQAFGGLVFMDFDPAHRSPTGHGRYEPLDRSLLPPLLVAWRPVSAEHSGAVHGDLRARHTAGDPTVHAAMRRLGEHARRARASLLAGAHGPFTDCMDASFDLRARMLALDPRHVEMVHAARAAGAGANYAGSGGSIVAACRDEDHRARVMDALLACGAHVLALAAPSPLTPSGRAPDR